MTNFQLRPNAPSNPSRCLLCSNVKGPFVDPGMQLFDGTPYLCMACATSIGNAIGMVPADAYEKAKTVAVRAVTIADHLTDTAAALAGRVETLEQAANMDGIAASVVDALKAEGLVARKPGRPAKQPAGVS